MAPPDVPSVPSVVHEKNRQISRVSLRLKSKTNDDDDYLSAPSVICRKNTTRTQSKNEIYRYTDPTRERARGRGSRCATRTISASLLFQPTGTGRVRALSHLRACAGDACLLAHRRANAHVHVRASVVLMSVCSSSVRTAIIRPSTQLLR